MIFSVIILAVDRGFIARALLIFMPTDMGSDDHDINDASVTVIHTTRRWVDPRVLTKKM